MSGIGELINNEVTGLQVPPRDPHKLAQAIERLLDDPALREKLRSQARSQVEKTFCLKKNAIIMHPLPRRKEIDIKVDSDMRAKYWRQERNGMWTRVALIAKIFNVHKDITEPFGT